MSENEIKELILDAVGGNKKAVETIIRSIQDQVYSLCLKYLWQEQDAQEACQESLIKIVTHLSQFNFNSKFGTWVYQVTLNHLKDKRRSSPSNKGITFTLFEEDLLSEQIEPSNEVRDSQEFAQQLSEIRLSCTTALLQCLDEDHRLAYVLGEILELDHKEAAEILGVESATFRKRLERSRAKIETFTANVCGAVSPRGRCQCAKRLNYAKSCGRVDFKRYPFLNSMKNKSDALDYIRKIEIVKRTAEHYRATYHAKAPLDFGKILKFVELN